MYQKNNITASFERILTEMTDNSTERTKGTSKSNGRKDALDRFYTKPETSAYLVSSLLSEHPEYHGKIFIEPSAGQGSFVYALETKGEKIIAYDILPAENRICHSEIHMLDFTSDSSAAKVKHDAKNINADCERADMIIIGNPPFGVQGNLSIEFVRKGLEIASVVWFILPPSFMKHSYLKRIGNVEIIGTMGIDDKTYILPDSNQRYVPSIFIGYRKTNGDKQEKTLPELLDRLPFEFCNRNEAEFSIRRVGGKAGTASTDLSLSKQSNYFCRMKNTTGQDENAGNKNNVADIISKINSIDFPERDYVVGPRSVSKRELAEKWIERYMNNV